MALGLDENYTADLPYFMLVSRDTKCQYTVCKTCWVSLATLRRMRKVIQTFYFLVKLMSLQEFLLCNTFCYKFYRYLCWICWRQYNHFRILFTLRGLHRKCSNSFSIKYFHDNPLPTLVGHHYFIIILGVAGARRPTSSHCPVFGYNHNL